MKYFVNFGTGAGNFTSVLPLEEVMREVEKEVAYTQQNVEIYGEDDVVAVAVLPWYGVAADQDEVDDGEVLIDFGDFGYYGNWMV